MENGANFKPGRKARIALGAIAALTAGALTIDQLTPRPFVAIFRTLIGLIVDGINIGPYADDIKRIGVSEAINVPSAGLPDAQLTMYTPADETPGLRPLILFIHGGGFTVGAAKQVGTFAKLLASNGYVVANLDYSLAPEYRYPTPIQQSISAINYLQQHASDYNADPSRFFIGGNSAGAQISSQLGAVMTNPELNKKIGMEIIMPTKNLKGVFLLNGVYDFDTVGRDKFPGFFRYGWSYTGKRRYVKYSRLDELSTVKNVTADFPATFLTAGDADPLEPQTYELDAVLRGKGVDTTSIYWTGSGRILPHDYIYQLDNPAARFAYKSLIDFINSKSQG